VFFVPASRVLRCLFLQPSVAPQRLFRHRVCFFLKTVVRFQAGHWPGGFRWTCRKETGGWRGGGFDQKPFPGGCGRCRVDVVQLAAAAGLEPLSQVATFSINQQSWLFQCAS